MKQIVSILYIIGLTGFLVACSDSSASTSIELVNNIEEEVEAIELQIYQNGNLLSSPHVSGADGSAIEQGEIYEFILMDEDEIDFEEPISFETTLINSQGKERTTVQNPTQVQLSKGETVTFEIIQESSDLEVKQLNAG